MSDDRDMDTSSSNLDYANLGIQGYFSSISGLTTAYAKDVSKAVGRLTVGLGGLLEASEIARGYLSNVRTFVPSLLN